MAEIEIIGRLEYTKKHNKCNTCEFVPPCRLCTWVDEDILNNDTGIILNRKYHIKQKNKKMKKLYRLHGKGKDVNESNVIVL